jgi:DnaJ-class molecular chaperone
MGWPVGSCNQCDKASWNAAQLHGACKLTSGCSGTMVTTDDVDNWENYPVCLGKGRMNMIRCERCIGVGLLLRHPLPN